MHCDSGSSIRSAAADDEAALGAHSDEDRALLNSGRSSVGGKDGVMVAAGELACVIKVHGHTLPAATTGLPMAYFYVRRWPVRQSSTAPTCPSATPRPRSWGTSRRLRLSSAKPGNRVSPTT
jgi:hypothetical protein